MPQERNLNTINAMLLATSFSATIFWIMNIFKVVSPAFKNFLQVYNPAGPLSGLFVYSIVGFVVFWLLWLLFSMRANAKKYLKASIITFYVTTVLFFFMVWPGIFEAIAGIFKG